MTTTRQVTATSPRSPSRPAKSVKARMTVVPRAVRYAWGQIRRRVWLPVTITDPPSDAIVEWNIAVPMRDGVLLRINVFRPDDADQHPVLLCLHPYGKDALPRKRRFRAGYTPSIQYPPDADRSGDPFGVDRVGGARSGVLGAARLGRHQRRPAGLGKVRRRRGDLRGAGRPGRPPTRSGRGRPG